MMCESCDGHGCYWTEWGDTAENDPELRALVIEYPWPPDGTVLIGCPECGGSGESLDDPEADDEAKV